MATGKHHESDYLYTRYLQGVPRMQVATAETPRQRYGVALIGLGRAGSIHLENILQCPRLLLCALVETDTQRLTGAAARYCLDDSVKLLPPDQAQDLFATDKRLTAVIVATPSSSHEELVSGALTAGLHVLCEKPIALNLPAVQRCYQLAREHKRVLLCAFNRRLDPAYSALAERVRDGEVGQVQSISTVSRDSPHPAIEYLRISGGIFHDCIVHDVDIMCHVLGQFPVKVLAAGHAFNPEIAEFHDHDTVSCILRFPSGAIGHISTSRHAVYGYDQRLEVHGSKGMLAAGNQRPHQLVAFSTQGEVLPPIFHSFPSRYHESYRRQTEEFVRVMDGEGNEISEESVVSVLKIVTALERSVQTEAFVTVEY